MDAAASCARGAGRAGRPCEPAAACGRAALKSGEAFWRSRMSCVRQNRVVLAVVATVKPLRRCARAQPGGRHRQFAGVREARRKVRLPGEHGISRPTIAQGRPSDLAPPVCCCAVPLCVLFAQRTVGATSAPGLPCALLDWRGSQDQAKLGRNAPRECEGVFAATRALSSSALCALAHWGGRSSISEAVVIESSGRSVLDSPPQPVIGLAKGETRWRGMTAEFGDATVATHSARNDEREEHALISVRAPDAAQRSRRCEASSGAVHCRAGAHPSASDQPCSGSRLCAAARPGHEIWQVCLLAPITTKCLYSETIIPY